MLEAWGLIEVKTKPCRETNRSDLEDVTRCEALVVGAMLVLEEEVAHRRAAVFVDVAVDDDGALAQRARCPRGECIVRRNHGQPRRERLAVGPR